MARPAPLVVLSVGTGPAARGVTLWGPVGVPAAGEVRPATLIDLHAALRADLAAPPGLLLAASDVDAVARERTAAARLAGLLDDPALREIRDALVRTRAHAPDLRLLVDARSAEARALPWELLQILPADRGPLGGLRVLRLQAAAPGPTPSPTGVLMVRLWVADPDDPVSRRAADAARAAAEAAGAVVQPVPADLSGAPRGSDADGGGPAVLHLITHGSRALDRVGLHAPDRPRSADAVAHGLTRYARGARLCVVDVCGGAEATADPADAPAWRLALAGLPAVVGPRTRWSEDAAATFGRALYGALAAGDSVDDAVDAGRIALRMLAVAHETCRWWVPTLVLTAPPAAGLRLRAVGPRIPGWPAPAADAAELLRHAGAAARGYLGVEHLVAALADPAVAVPPAVAAVRPALAQAAAALPPRPLDGAPRPTPRLAELGGLLPAGFTVRALARALCVVNQVARALDPAARAALLAPDADDGPGTLPLDTLPLDLSPEDPRRTGLHLEIEGGPDDGLRLSLAAPGGVIGRWDPLQPDQRDGRLFVDRPDGDRTLSRQHLRVTAPGVVEIRGATKLSRGGEAPRTVRGELALQPGDTLVLGAVTTGRVRG